MRAMVQALPMSRVLPLLLLALLGVLIVACGRPAAASGDGGSGFSTEPADQTIVIRAHPHGHLSWTEAEYTARAGDVTFVVVNTSLSRHNFLVEGPGVKAQSPAFEGGTTQRYTLKGLQPGTYRIACTVPGHREAGMTATLQVR